MILNSDLNKTVRILSGDDIGKEGKLIRLYLKERNFAVVQFNNHEYGLYDVNQIAVLQCC
jgi:hypothetical protein